MKLHLYSNKSEDIFLNKVLINERIIEGTMRDSLNIMSPSIELNIDTDILKYNYAYIEELERYYYINDKTCIREGYWSITLDVDVLMSFKDSILKQKCFVVRNEFNYDSMIVDEFLPVKSGKKVDYIISDTESPFESPFDTENAVHKYSWALSAIVDVDNIGNGAELWRLDNEKKYASYKCTTTNMLRTYLLKDAFWSDSEDVYSIQNIINQLQDSEILCPTFFGGVDGNPLESIYSFIRYPFDVSKFIGDSNTYGNGQLYDLYVSSHRFKIAGDVPTASAFKGKITSSSAYFKLCGHIKFNGDSFLHTDKFSNYTLYLPYVGFVNLDGDVVYNKDIYIWYSLDVVTGCCVCCITLDYRNPLDSNKILLTINGKMGYSIPIGSSNAHEINRQNVNRVINFAKDIGMAYFTKGSSLTSSSSKTETMSGRVVEDVVRERSESTGRLRTTESFTTKESPSYISSESKTYTHKQMKIPSIPSLSMSSYTKGTIGNEINNLFLNNNIFAVIESPNISVDDTDFYAHTYGKPCAITDILSNFNGYTEVGEVHLTDVKTANTYATPTEVKNIYDELSKGIII